MGLGFLSEFCLVWVGAEVGVGVGVWVVDVALVAVGFEFCVGLGFLMGLGLRFGKELA